MVGAAVDLVQPNVLSVGGYTEAIKVAHMAHAFNLKVANGGGWPHHNAHLIAAVPNGWRVEFHAQTWRVGETLFRDPPGPVKGWVTLTEQPGLGLEPREDALRECLVKK
jgi:L-alanine-DL-glutamate epimerase-like enolase superfamily enzyme